MPPIISSLKQSFRLPAPPLTESNIGDLTGKVCLVTGGNSGVGYQLVSILYSAHATVYLAGRNAQACSDAIDSIRTSHPNSRGSLAFLKLDLSDLSSIKASAEDLLKRADRLDFLCNNAGVMFPPKGSVGAQGHELQLVTNVLAPYLFTDLVRPLLVSTAKAEREQGREGGVRVAWAGSLGIDTISPKGGVTLVKGDSGLDEQKVLGPQEDYGQSKAANLFLATSWGEEVKADGIVSTSFNPGNLRTNLTRHTEAMMPVWILRIMQTLFLFPAVYGAYTELYCGFGHDLTVADNGRYIAPWGRKWHVRPDVEETRTGEMGRRYFEMVKREVARYR